MGKERGVKRLYNWERWLFLRRVPLLPKAIQRLIRVVYGATIPYTCDIGPGTRFPHGAQGVVLHQEAVIGRDCVIQCSVVLGGRKGLPGAPKLGDRVEVGAGAVLLGDIVVGDAAWIGANAVLLQSIPPRAVAVGVPAKVLRVRPPQEL